MNWMFALNVTKQVLPLARLLGKTVLPMIKEVLSDNGESDFKTRILKKHKENMQFKTVKEIIEQNRKGKKAGEKIKGNGNDK